jgi:hypothetical protein
VVERQEVHCLQLFIEAGPPPMDRSRGRIREVFP